MCGENVLGLDSGLGAVRQLWLKGHEFFSGLNFLGYDFEFHSQIYCEVNFNH